MFGIYINCSKYPFILWIIAGLKQYETRAKNMLKSLIGKTVFIIQTGKGSALVIATATIKSAEKIPYSNKAARIAAKIYKTQYDTKPNQYKYFYKLENVKPLEKPFPVPQDRINHGRSYTEFLPPAGYNAERN